jgi:outer membrane protein assembly factor BamB
MSTPEKNIKLLQTTGYVSGMFTLFIAIIVILAYIQVETIKPLENPSLVSLREQYDNDPNNEDLKEQVRTLDLMARKAFFTARWQIETGTYLLLAGALIFVISQRLLLSTRKKIPDIPEAEYDLIGLKRKSRLALMGSFVVLTLMAFVISFLLRIKLPDPFPVPDEAIVEEVITTVKEPAPRTPVTQQDEVPEPETEIADDQQELVAAEEQVDETSTEPAKASNRQYPFFRGQGSRGKVVDQEYPVNWDGNTGQNIEWKVQVPYIGYSSPVIWGDRIFLTGAEGAETVIMCFNKSSGKLMWTASATGVPGEPGTPPETSEDTGLAAPTAATNGRVVCAIFATGTILCCDYDGNRIWAKNLGVPQNPYGHASSLIIHENKLLVQYDHRGKKSLMAFDVDSGNLMWETIRPVATSWASPVITEFNGIIQVILVADPNVISYDVNTGREIWSVECISGEVGPSLAVNSKYVFSVNDYSILAAINPAEPASIVWADNEYTPDISSPVATEELVFVLTSWGGVACYDSETGNLVWDHDFNYGFFASPIVASNNVYMLDQAGVMHVVKAEREFQLVADSPLGERTVCTPAFSENKIYIRSEEHLYCISE